MNLDYHSEAAKPHRILVVNGRPRLSLVEEAVMLLGLLGISAGAIVFALTVARAL
jgi:hypothetical protein